MRKTSDVVRALAAQHDGVVTRPECVALGVHPSWLDRRVRAGEWQRLHPGVLVTYSGPLTWRTRARAALLHAGPGAALSHRSAAYVHEWVDDAPRLLEVSISHERRVARSPGVVIRRRRTMPPAGGRLRTVARGHTVLDLLAVAASEDDAVGPLTAALRGRTHPDDVLDALASRPGAPRRAMVLELLAACEDGVESALELRYHRDVERRHGLPRGRSQVSERVGGRWIRADRWYEEWALRVELDGRLAHPFGRTDADTWRDNAVLLERGELTLRYRWSHVRLTPCATAGQVAAALRARGWTGSPRSCGPACTLR
ncbi:MAG TPA: type IV toxin-antitoxin system AbiEi family antitoxin domain-containing protein [Nocardioides sp.]|nr:type IV toxin-antitoxin system AbiEi family antitoxin domain-containing protein [Nocardioides sp.]